MYIYIYIIFIWSFVEHLCFCLGNWNLSDFTGFGSNYFWRIRVPESVLFVVPAANVSLDHRVFVFVRMQPNVLVFTRRQTSERNYSFSRSLRFLVTRAWRYGGVQFRYIVARRDSAAGSMARAPRPMSKYAAAGVKRTNKVNGSPPSSHLVACAHAPTGARALRPHGTRPGEGVSQAWNVRGGRTTMVRSRAHDTYTCTRNGKFNRFRERRLRARSVPRAPNYCTCRARTLTFKNIAALAFDTSGHVVVKYFQRGSRLFRRARHVTSLIMTICLANVTTTYVVLALGSYRNRENSIRESSKSGSVEIARISFWGKCFFGSFGIRRIRWNIDNRKIFYGNGKNQEP